MRQASGYANVPGCRVVLGLGLRKRTLGAQGCQDGGENGSELFHLGSRYCWGQKACRSKTTSRTVRTMICKSSARDQLRRYSRSYSTRAFILSTVSVSPLKPFT